MTDRKPNRFISIHNHSGFSPYDGLGHPNEHFEWCMENGIPGHAITEHGNVNSYAHAELWLYEKRKEDDRYKSFTFLPGVEAYFHPDLEQWKADKLSADNAKASAREAKKLKKKSEDIISPIGMSVDPNTDETIDVGVDMTNALTIENEDESKSTKNFNPVNRRHHLVVLPKNQRGLLKIFNMVSRSYIDGFYRFPRVDAKMLKAACSTGDVIISSACLGGFLSWSVFQVFQKLSFDSLNQNLLDDVRLLDKCVDAVGNAYQLLSDCAGRDNTHIEIQFNRLPAQNLVNRAMLEFATRSGLTDKLVVTCDAHYSRPELWKEREIYKKLGWMNYTEINPDSIPKSKDELKCELYPKNHEQIWDEYLTSKQGTNFYSDEIICEAIERSHDIAKEIGNVPRDMSQKYPNKLLVPKDKTSHEHLVDLCKTGMKKRGLEGRPEYEERLIEELGVIEQMKNSEYFVMYQKVIELAHKVTLIGSARGSGGGSLVNYVLYITGLDPLYWGLPFSRFLSIYRVGYPDIDCLESSHLIQTNHGPKYLKNIVVGDKVVSHDLSLQTVLFVEHRKQRQDELCFEFLLMKQGVYGTVVSSENHRLLKHDQSEVLAKNIVIGDTLFPDVRVIGKNVIVTDSLTDIEVSQTRTFQVIPYDVVEINKNQSRCLIHVNRYGYDISKDCDFTDCRTTEL